MTNVEKFEILRGKFSDKDFSNDFLLRVDRNIGITWKGRGIIMTVIINVR